jgi:serine/threonine protein kinase/Tol biopolymer transport system component
VSTEADRWRRVDELLQSALARPAEERRAFLADACGGDEPLRREVASLLAAHDRPGPLDAPLSQVAADALDAREPKVEGSSIGPYQVLDRLGAGGMGVVYRARDTRIGREVAVKVLPASYSSDSDRLRRFEQEARAAGALNHPNVLTIHDVGRHAGTPYLVSELLEGETLRARLERGALPWKKAVEAAAAIADGLAAAHAKGIVHRDLKPENVFVTHDGRLKVLDFGLAKLWQPVSPAAGSGTTLEQTGAGQVLGTVGYMSPEQVAGKPVDARSDLFALGSVLYELASGRPAFKRPTAAETMTAILKDEPSELEAVPAELRRLIAHCVEKDPDARFHSARDLAFSLRALLDSAGSEDTRAATRTRRSERVAWLAAAAMAAAALALAVRLGTDREPKHLVRSYLLPPDGADFCSECGMAVSPDGRRLAFVVARSGDVRGGLWVQPLGGTAQRLEGTDFARAPFWSPDSRSVAFFTPDGLKRVDASGGLVQKVCGPCQGAQGSWGKDGVLVFGRVGNALSRVSASGGEPSPLTVLDANRKDRGHSLPVFLADGRRFLFRVFSYGAKSDAIYWASLDAPTPTLVARAPEFTIARSGLGAGSGHLLYVQANTLMAAPFDERRLRLLGDAAPVAKSVASFSVSANGVLVYSEAPSFRVAWVDRSGREVGALPIRGDVGGPRLSHDGRRIAFTRFPEGSGQGDIWVYDLGREVELPIVTAPGGDTAPLWSPDDQWIVFTSDRGGQWDLYRKASTGVGADELFFGSALNLQASSWSRDGRWLILNVPFQLTDPRPQRDLWSLSLPEMKATRLFDTAFHEWGGQLSPDGRFIAYNSNETGAPEIFVQSFPPSGARWRISTGGGLTPRWRSDGKELFYIEVARRAMMAVEVRPGPVFEAGPPRPLWEATGLRVLGGVGGGATFDVTADGQRFLVVKTDSVEGKRPITLVQNWTAGLKN